MYADDTQLMISFDPDNDTIAFQQMDMHQWHKEMDEGETSKIKWGKNWGDADRDKSLSCKIRKK